MSRPTRTLQKHFIVFCEGDTEYNYIDKMRLNPGVKITLKPINMRGGGYANFLSKIKTEAQTNCLAKFIIIDGDRIKNSSQERACFLKLLQYCQNQNQRGNIAHFLIVNYPDFEYVACLHCAGYKNQDVEKFLLGALKLKSIAQFKANKDVFQVLNVGDRSLKNVLAQSVPKLVANVYNKKMRDYSVSIQNTTYDEDNLVKKCSNIAEFFDVIDW